MSREHAILTPELTPYDRKDDDREGGVEYPLRPKTLGEYIGQDLLKEKLGIYIDAAKSRKDPIDHCLFYGPPGLGKTSLAHIVAHEMGSHLHTTSGPVIERPGDLAALLTNLEPFDVLFIDEIHRLNPVVEEILYPAMEDRALDIMIGQGPSARSIKIDLPPFTLIGSTTRAGALTSPLRDRFGISERLYFYTADELCRILLRSAALLRIAIDERGAHEIAGRSRGTPRIVNRLLRRIRDFAQVRGSGSITEATAKEGLQLLDIDAMGLDPMDRKLLRTVIEAFGGGPVGIETLSASLAEDKETLEDMYEPFLLQEGFIQRTPRGRVCTGKAYEHLGFPPPGRSEANAQVALNLEPTGGPLW